MCLLCEGYDEDEINRGIELRIATFGWSLQSVYPGPDGDPDGAYWTYTIGLTQNFGLAELVVTDLNPEAAGSMLNWAAGLLTTHHSLDELASRGVTWRPVHNRHLAGDLVGGWINYYDEWPSAGFVQLLPAPSAYCAGHRHVVADLSDPDEEFPTNRPIAHAS